MTLSEAMKLSKVMPVCRTSQSATQGSKRSLSSPGPAPCRTSGCRSSLAVLHAPPLDVPGLPPAPGLWTRWGPSGTRFLQMSSRSLPQLLRSRLTGRPIRKAFPDALYEIPARSHHARAPSPCTIFLPGTSPHFSPLYVCVLGCVCLCIHV